MDNVLTNFLLLRGATTLDLVGLKKTHNVSNDPIINSLVNIIMKKRIKQPNMQDIVQETKRDLFLNAVDYHATIKTDANVPWTFNNEKVVISLGKDEWLSINVLTDLYVENIRMSCKRYFQEKSPNEMWIDRKSLYKIIGSAVKKSRGYLTWTDLRDSIFKVTSECNTFRITVAKSVYSFTECTRIFDASAGWGDRLIAAMAYAQGNPRFKYYHATDPNKNMSDKYKQMISDFGNKEQFKVWNSPFEDLDLSYKYDLIYTSPPFFVLEDFTYEDRVRGRSQNVQSQSIERYKTVNEWLLKFLLVPFLRAFKSLVIGGHLILNLEDTHSIQEYTKPFIYAFSWLCPDCDYLGSLSYKAEDARQYRPQWTWVKTKCPNKRSDFFQNMLKELYPDIYGYLEANM